MFPESIVGKEICTFTWSIVINGMEFEDVEIWTYEGDFDLGEYVIVPETGKIKFIVDPDSVAKEDYDYNVASGDSDKPQPPTPDEGYPAGTLFTLDETPVYTTYSIGSSFDTRSGDYYIYDSAMVNERIRVCRLEDNVEMPARSVGWCNVMDLYNLTTLSVGDLVTVTGKLYVNKYSRDRYIIMEGENMYIREVYTNENTDCPYALSFEVKSAIIGYASEDMLVKVY